MKAVKFCAILQREHTSKEVFKKGKKEAGTLGRLRVCTLEGQDSAYKKKPPVNSTPAPFPMNRE
ncbi:hypothetical protein [Helicobacter salomonis]|uniref:hypothetical protein n=1 Tax=Helicobacter salomonis TaxID=56878 RepID=UPI000CF1176F|nr:hypothetical protein [Helicobacter salomonis]